VPISERGREKSGRKGKGEKGEGMALHTSCAHPQRYHMCACMQGRGDTYSSVQEVNGTALFALVSNSCVGREKVWKMFSMSVEIPGQIAFLA